MKGPHEALCDRFRERFHRSPDHLAFAPGRVNLIGEHTDYNGGLALPVAMDRWVLAAVAARADRRVRAESAGYGSAEFDLGEPPGAGRDVGQAFSAFVQGATEIFRIETGLDSGFDLLVHSDVSPGSGLSSSAALLVAMLLALEAHSGHPLTWLRLAQMARQVENDYLGLPSGLLDPIASRTCRAGHALLIDFRTLRLEQVPLRQGSARWLLADTGVRRSLAGSEYGRRVSECERGWKQLQALFPDLTHKRDLTASHLSRLERADAVAARRLRHYVTENDRVLRMTGAIASGEAEEMGRILLQSHQSLKEDYEVSCPELDLLVEAARDVPGWSGARMVGGGFGGCTLHLVEESAREALIAGLDRRYLKETGRKPVFIELEAAGGAGTLAVGAAG